VAADYRPDPVLLDVAMPGMDGWAVARRLGADPATRGARIISVTGYAHEADRRQSLKAGCDDLWVKPIAAEQLSGLLESLRQGQDREPS
jgi:CheY-like chemotaxis protein